MKPGLSSGDEQRRLEVLRQYEVLDTPPEEAFDQLTALAAKICETPIAFICFVDEKRQWLKSKIGLTVSQTSREHPLCSQAVGESELLVVPDSAGDKRFAGDPHVAGDSPIRFYARAPLVSPEGQTIGFFGVADRVARELRVDQQEALRALSRQVVTQLELRRRARELVRIQADRDRLVNAERASRESERKYRELVEHANSIILRWTRDGRVTFLNEFGQEFFGYSAEEILGRHVVGTIVPETESTHRDLRPLMEQIAADPKAFEQNVNENMRRNGERVWIAWTNKIVLDEQGQVREVLSIGQDITERKVYEREIERLNRLYAVLSQLDQTVVRVHSREELFQEICRVIVKFGGFKMAWIGQHNPATGMILPASQCGDDQGYLSEIRCTTEGPEGGSATAIAVREGRPYVANDLPDDLQALRWREAAARHGFRAAAAFPIRLQGEVRAVLTICALEPGCFGEDEVALLEEATMNISFALEAIRREGEQRTAKLALVESETRYRFLFEHNPMPMLIYERMTQHILAVNEAFVRIYGYSREEALRLHLTDLYPEEERARIGEVARDLHGHANVGEWRHRKRDGSLITIVASSHDVVYEGREGRVAVMADISDRKRAEEELQAARAGLEQRVRERTAELAVAKDRAESADRLKSAFLATMSHELRTPLNSIIGFTGIILQGLAGPLTAEQTKQLGMVKTSARHLLALINDVLDISKIEAGQLEIRAEPFDLRTSLEKVVALVRPAAEKKGLALRLDLEPAALQVVSDRLRVEQVLLNLLNNAVKFTERGGVALVAEPVGHFRVHQTGLPHPAVRLRVTDTGIGIQPHDLEKLFQPFRQIDSGMTRRHEGTGLGLAICRRLADLLGGEISVESVWGRGSAFSLTLPLNRLHDP